MVEILFDAPGDCYGNASYYAGALIRIRSVDANVEPLARSFASLFLRQFLRHQKPTRSTPASHA
jgi:hypothetical protein